MFPRRPAAKILPRNQNAGACVTRFIENKSTILLPIRRKPPIVKQKLSKASPLNPLQKLLRDNLVGINVDPLQRRNAPAMSPKWIHLCTPFSPSTTCHPERSENFAKRSLAESKDPYPACAFRSASGSSTCTLRTRKDDSPPYRNFHSRISVKCPAIAAAAAIIGLTRCVRPPRPCRPSKFLLLVEAHLSPGRKISGFIPKHIEHPDSLHSNPASRKIRCKPSCSAARFTVCDPGTTIARTFALTWCPLATRA